MKSVSKKIVCAGLMLAALSTNVFAAKKKTSKKEKSPYDNVETRKDAKGKTIDLGGIYVELVDWWAGDDFESGDAVSVQDADTRAWHKWTQQKYNYSFKQTQKAGWDSHPQFVSNFCITGGKENYVFTIDNRSVIIGMKAGLYYDLSKIKSVDWSNKKWELGTREIMSMGSSFYSMRYIQPEPRGGVFFNKRLLEEAGIDPEEPYDLQKAGKWTWDAFEGMLKKCTRDLDNDGIPDTYGMANSSTEFVPLAVMSNGDAMIARENGKFVNHMGSEKSIEAMTWCAHLATNYEKPQPEGSNWDWMYPAFINGEVAFQVDQEYNAQSNGKYSAMTDDWGFVSFPLGPKGDGKYRTLHNDNLYVLPACYDDATAEKIVTAFDIWTDPTPGYDSDDSWKEGFYHCFRDSRAVDETLQYMLDNPNPRYDTLIPDINYMGDVIWVVYPGFVTPQEAYENSKNVYEGLLKDANR